ESPGRASRASASAGAVTAAPAPPPRPPLGRPTKRTTPDVFRHEPRAAGWRAALSVACRNSARREGVGQPRPRTARHLRGVPRGPPIAERVRGACAAPVEETG